MSDRPVAVLTGASRGIGEAIALRLAEEGWNLTLISRSIDKASALLESLSRPEDHLLLAADVSLFSEAERCVSESMKRFGRLDALINNAGILRDGLLLKVKDGEMTKMSLAQWQAVIDVNLTGVFLCTREVAAKMVELKTGGAIINISSISRAGNVGQTNYSAAKAGVAAATVPWARPRT